jgi:hypothetical protein
MTCPGEREEEYTMIRTYEYYEQLRRIDGTLAILAHEVDRIQTEIGKRVCMTVEIYGEQPADDVIRLQACVAQAQCSLADTRAYVIDGARVAIGASEDDEDV